MIITTTTITFSVTPATDCIASVIAPASAAAYHRRHCRRQHQRRSHYCCRSRRHRHCASNNRRRTIAVLLEGVTAFHVFVAAAVAALCAAVDMFAGIFICFFLR